MLINGKSFPLYLMDTKDTIIKRIASEMNTEPKWLVFSPLFDNFIKGTTADEVKYLVIDTLKSFYKSNSLSFPGRGIETPIEIPNSELERIFLSTNIPLNIADDNKLKIFFFSIRKSFLNIDIDLVWRERKEINDKLRKSIENNKKYVSEFVKEAKIFERIPSIDYSEIEIDHIQFTIRIVKDINISISELFNSIRTNKKNPFSAYYPEGNGAKPLYKIFRQFQPSLTWLELESENVIISKVNGENDVERRRESKDLFRSFSNSVFTIIDNDLYATMDVKVDRFSVSKTEFIDRALSIFIDPSYGTRMFTYNKVISDTLVENLTISYFSFPLQCMDIDVFSELAMNNPIFSSLVTINEFVQAVKTKQNIYLHINNSEDTVALFPKRTIKHHMYGIKEIGEPYVRCRVKTDMANKIPDYQLVLGKLFNVYNLERDNVILQYRKYIPNFLKKGEHKCDRIRKPSAAVVIVGKEEKVIGTGLRDIAPLIFVSNYSRKCLHPPIIVDDTIASKTKSQVMRFPIKGEDITRNYICDDKQYKYPGLRDNTLENKDRFPFIPCCYVTDQTKKKGSSYREYFEGEKVEKIHHIQEVYISNKILPPGVIGKLPKRIDDLFGVIEGDDTDFYYGRKGVHRSKLSFMECILTAKGYRDVSQQILQNELSKLCTEKYAMAAKQELYDESIESIISTMKNDDFKATLFVRIMEVAYDCNIFVFTNQSGIIDEGELAIPRHSKAYYKFEPNRPTIFVYQHMGSEGDHAEYPQCELIVKIKRDDVKINYNIFSPSDNVSQKIFKLFRRLSRSYIFGTPIPIVRIRKLPIIEQCVDLYGKCRMINIESTDGEILTIFVDPLPPFAAVSIKKSYRCNLETFNRFIKKWDVQILWQRINNQNTVREIGIKFGVNGIVIVHWDNVVLDNIPIKRDDEEYRMYDGKSIILQTDVSKYEKTRRISKLLYAYTLFAVSKYLSTRSLNEPFEKVIENFIKTNVIINGKGNNNYDISNIHAAFDINNKIFFNDNGKLIVPSLEALRRLMFMVHQYSKYRMSRLLEIKDLKSIPDFYSDISDYDDIPNQYIMEGNESIISLIKSYEAKYIVTRTILPESKATYFFKSNLLANIMYMATNTLSLDMAITILQEQPNKNVNKNVNYRNISIYKYVNENDIKELQKGSDNIILAYLYNNKPSYTVLIPLNILG